MRPVTRRPILTFSLLASLGVLFFFKYFDPSNPALHAVFDPLGISPLLPGLTILLPLGISYFTFQTMSYTLDVYLGVVKVERYPGLYALFIAFYPQVIARPIARANQLLPQFHTAHDAVYEQVVSELQRVGWGFFKKLVIADRRAVAVNMVYVEYYDFSNDADIKDQPELFYNSDHLGKCGHRFLPRNCCKR